MHLLVLGGTRFVGRAVVDAAVAAGHRRSGRREPGPAAGLSTRPVAGTVAATREWDQARGGPVPGTDPFTPEQELAVLTRAA